MTVLLVFRADEFHSPVCLLLLPNVLQHSSTELAWKKQTLSLVFSRNNCYKIISNNTFHFDLTTEILLPVFELQFCSHVKKMENVA